MSGYGAVEGSSGGSDPGALTNDGTITAVGGVLSISDDITTGTGASGNFAIASGATLEFSGSVDTGQTVAFSGSNADLTLDQPGANGANFNPFIEDFFSTDQISIDNFAASSVSYVGGSYVLSDGSTQVDLDFGSAQSISTLSYKVSGGDTIVTTDVAPCYCRGTLILADAGEVAVQDLKIGDLVLTSSGAARPIKWIGRRSYGGRFAIGRKDILPVCIKAGALDDRVPRRDLWISPHHAMYLEGVLIEAKDLLNGVSIVQAERIDAIEYFHIELETHDVIVAEGALSESFIDDDSRGMFHNAHEYAVRYPETQTGRMQYCAPRCEDGFDRSGAAAHRVACGAADAGRRAARRHAARLRRSHQPPPHCGLGTEYRSPGSPSVPRYLCGRSADWAGAGKLVPQRSGASGTRQRPSQLRIHAAGGSRPHTGFRHDSPFARRRRIAPFG